MPKKSPLIFFSSALLISSVIMGGSLIYFALHNASAVSGRGDSVKVADSRGFTYAVEKDEPLKLTVISDAACQSCSTEPLETELKRQTGLPLAVRRLDYQAEEAKTILQENHADFLPYLLADRGIEKLPAFAHLTHHFISKTNGGYYIDLSKMGAPVGRYLSAVYYDKDDSEAPRIVALTREHGFGDVRVADGKVSTEFSIKNEGKSPLEFLNVNTSCGCTSAKVVLPGSASPEYMMAGHQEPVKWRGSLEQGEEGTIVVYYDPAVHPDLNEAVTRVLTIDTNDPNTPQLEIKIHANQIAL